MPDRGVIWTSAHRGGGGECVNGETVGPEAERPISENIRRGLDAVLRRLDHGCKVLVLYRGAM